MVNITCLQHIKINKKTVALYNGLRNIFAYSYCHCDWCDMRNDNLHNISIRNLVQSLLQNILGGKSFLCLYISWIDYWSCGRAVKASFS